MSITDVFPKISLILPVFNAEVTLKKSINCILESDYPSDKLEIIVIDDGSSDNSPEIIKSFKNVSKFDYLIITQKNLGAASAKNTGFSKASGEIIFLVSADVYISRDYLKLVSASFRDNSIGISQGPLKRFDGVLDSPLYHCTIQPVPSYSYVAAAIAYKAEAMDKAGRYFDEKLSYCGDDTDLALRIINKGYRYEWVKSAEAYHDIVPKDLKSLIRKFTATTTSKIVLLIKLHPELRSKLLIKRVFWPGYYKGRLGAISIVLALPLLFILGLIPALSFLCIWFVGMVSYVLIGQYGGLKCTKKVYLLMPIVIIADILSHYLTIVKFIVYSIKYRTLVL